VPLVTGLDPVVPLVTEPDPVVPLVTELDPAAPLVIVSCGSLPTSILLPQAKRAIAAQGASAVVNEVR